LPMNIVQCQNCKDVFMFSGNKSGLLHLSLNSYKVKTYQR
jgi:hypothetical protein